MKIKNLLATILCIAMVLSTMTTVAFADATEADVWDGTIDTRWYNETDTVFTLTTAEQLAGLAELVSGDLTFKGVTVKLANNLDLYCEDITESADGDPLTFRPIGDHSKNGSFEGVFDGDGHTISNLYQNGWDLGYQWGIYGSYGLFGNVNNATIKNLNITGSESYIEGGDVAGITGSATGTCVFENITITDSDIATYNNGCGGIIGWSGAGNYTFKNISIAEDVTLAGLWGSFDSSIGGVVGQAEPGAIYNFDTVNIACRIDAYNDVTASYDYYNYRMCGMIIGRLEATTTIDGRNYPDMSQYDINLDNVNVTIGEWANYHYCRAEGSRGVRVEAGYAYDGIGEDYDHNKCTMHHMEIIPFDQLFGGDQFGVRGANKKILAKQNFDVSTLTVNNEAKESISVAIVDDEYKETLQDAIDATGGNGTVTLIKDVEESVTVKAPAVQTFALTAESGVTIDLADFDLKGSVVVEAGATAKLTNGSIINEDASVSAVQSFGTTTLENVDVTSARHAVRVEGGLTTIEGGSYKVGTANMTTHAVNVSDGGKVVINGGIFEGPAKTANSDSGAAVNIQAGSEGEINGGEFLNGKLNTLSAEGTLTVNGGSFDQDVTDYVATDKECVYRGDFGLPYTVEPKATQTIEVKLEKESGTDNLYNIILKSDDTSFNIHEFVAAELVFENKSTTLSGATMNYEVSGLTEKGTVAQKAIVDDKEQYIINLTDGEKRLSGDDIIIGQIEFIGQGTIDFSITSGKIATTSMNTNLGRYYTTDNGKLILGADATIDGSVSEITRDVVINVAYNHPLQNVWDAPEMKVTLKDYFGNEYTDSIEDGNSIADGIATFKNVSLGRITVILEAPGFRKFVYNTTLDEADSALVLNFWNDVKVDSMKESIEAGQEKMTHNFVVGDIVMDYIVDKYDLAAVTSYYGMYNIANNSKFLMYDLNRDGDIDIRDVQYVLHTMGK